MTYKIKKGRLYISTQDGKVEEIYPQDVKLDGISYKLHKDLYKELDNKYIQLQNTLETSIYAIREFLSKNGINTPNDDLKSLINDLYTLKVIQSGVEYLNVEFDLDGYIVDITPYNSISNNLLNVVELPNDVTNGYYIINDDGVIVKDEQKYKEYWSVI